MPGPLDGIRVVDLTSMVSGPLATLLVEMEHPSAGRLRAKQIVG